MTGATNITSHVISDTFEKTQMGTQQESFEHRFKTVLTHLSQAMSEMRKDTFLEYKNAST